MTSAIAAEGPTVCGSAKEAIETLQRHAASMARGDESVRPGMEYRLNEAADIGEGVWQGDLGIEIVAVVGGQNYSPAAAQIQLVPGLTNGAKHCLADPTTVSDFQLPEGWDKKSYEGLAGPSFRCVAETKIVHPVHGTVTIAPGHNVTMRYQRNWEEEQKRARRSLD